MIRSAEAMLPHIMTNACLCVLSMLLLTAKVKGAIGQYGNFQEEYRERTWTRQQGLPDMQVTALAQAKDGYIWIGTRMGLSRFDGLRFTAFNHINAPEMTSDYITALAADVDGSLWAATSSEILHRCLNGSFARYTIQDGLCDTNILRLYASPAGGVWVGTEKGLNRIQNGQVHRFTIGNNGLRSNHIRGLYEDLDGTLWLGLYAAGESVNGRMQKRLPTNGWFQDFSDITNLPNGCRANHILRGEEGLWLVEGDFLYLLSSKNEASTIGQRLPNPGPDSFLVADRAGNLWVPAGNMGLDCWHKGGFIRYPFPPDKKDDSYTCMIEDHEGNLWLGSRRSGLYCWQPRSVFALSAKDGLGNDNVWAVYESRDASVWLGTDGGVSRWFHGQFINYSENDGLARNSVRALVEDSSGSLWVGTGNGLDEFRSEQFHPRRYHGADLGSDPDEISVNKIRALLTTRDGSLWVAVAVGLHRIHDGKDTFYTVKDGLPGNDVRSLLEARDGSLWIGTAGDGVAQITYGGVPESREGEASLPAPGLKSQNSNPLDGKEINVSAADSLMENTYSNDGQLRFHSFNTSHGLSDNFISTMYEDADGTLWIGTENGLNRYSKGRFAVLTTQQGLFDNMVNCILEDNYGYFWLSCERGIYRVARSELDAVAEGKASLVQCKVYSEADGLLSVITNGRKGQPAGCKTRDGRLWFSTTKGVAIIDPERAQQSGAPPMVVIETVRANGVLFYHNSDPNAADNQPLDLKRKTTSAAKATSAGENIEFLFPPGAAQVIEISYTANTFIVPENARFKYRMRGFNDYWIETATHRTAYFTGLKPGRFEFEVTACDHQDTWNQEGAKMAFTLLPHYYERRFFYPLSGIALLLLCLGIYYWRFTEMRKIHGLEKQAVLLTERNRIGRDIHDNMGAQLSQIGLLTGLAQQELAEGDRAASHVIKKIADTARELSQGLDEIVWAINPQYDCLRSLMVYLRHYITEYASMADLQLNLIWPQTSPESVLSSSARHNIFLVIKEAMHNVAQHAGATEISIHAVIHDGLLTIKLEDNGRGFIVEDAGRLHLGNGLVNMEKRIAEVGGRFAIQSQIGYGTRIEVKLPLETKQKMENIRIKVEG